MNSVMNPYCNHINFLMFPLKHFDFDWTPNRQPTVADLSLDQINPELKKIMNDLGVYVSWVQVFYRPKLDYCSIHIDNRGGDYMKINWAFRGAGSKMTWYSVKSVATDDYYKGQVFKTEVNSEYIVYKPEDLILEHTAEIVEGIPALVQVGIPHHIDNQLEERYCISFSISDIKTHRRLTMQQAIDTFKDYL